MNWDAIIQLSKFCRRAPSLHHSIVKKSARCTEDANIQFAKFRRRAPRMQTFNCHKIRDVHRVCTIRFCHFNCASLEAKWLEILDCSRKLQTTWPLRTRIVGDQWHPMRPVARAVTKSANATTTTFSYMSDLHNTWQTLQSSYSMFCST